MEEKHLEVQELVDAYKESVYTLKTLNKNKKPPISDDREAI